MQYWSSQREVEKPKPTPTNLLELLDSMDAWLRNDTPIQGLTLDDVIEWREALAKHLNITSDWYERAGSVSGS